MAKKTKSTETKPVPERVAADITFEELVAEEMAVPVKVANPRPGDPDKIDAWRACVVSLKNKAVKGDIQSIMFLRQILDGKRKLDHESILREIQSQYEDLKAELKALRLPATSDIELWLLSKQLLTLRRIAMMTAQTGHTDIVATPQKSGPDKLELSMDNRIYNDLLKQWRADWKNYKKDLLQSELQRKMLK